MEDVARAAVHKNVFGHNQDTRTDQVANAHIHRRIVNRECDTILPGDGVRIQHLVHFILSRVLTPTRPQASALPGGGVSLPVIAGNVGVAELCKSDEIDDEIICCRDCSWASEKFADANASAAFVWGWGWTASTLAFSETRTRRTLREAIANQSKRKSLRHFQPEKKKKTLCHFSTKRLAKYYFGSSCSMACSGTHVQEQMWNTVDIEQFHCHQIYLFQAGIIGAIDGNAEWQLFHLGHQTLLVMLL